MTGLAQGDCSVKISANGRKDEIAAMASAVEVFRGNAIERKRLEAKQEADLAEKEQRVKAMDKLIRGFDEQITAVLNTVSSAATQLDGMAKEMNDVASKTNQLSTDASGAVNVASANVETVAAAAEELSKSIQEIGQKGDSAQGIALHAGQERKRSVKGKSVTVGLALGGVQ